MERVPAPEDWNWYRIRIDGGLGGHSGVDINKGRCSAVKAAAAILLSLSEKHDFSLATINIGEANASIASKGEMVIACPSAESQALILDFKHTSDWMHDEYPQDPDVKCLIEACEPQETVISPKTFQALMTCLCEVPQGVVRLKWAMPDTVETSNNIGRVVMEEEHIFVSTHTRSFIDDDMDALSKAIAKTFKDSGAHSEVVMSAPAWQEDLPGRKTNSRHSCSLPPTRSRMCWAGVHEWWPCTSCSKQDSSSSTIQAFRLPASAHVS